MPLASEWRKPHAVIKLLSVAIALALSLTAASPRAADEPTPAVREPTPAKPIEEASEEGAPTPAGDPEVISAVDTETHKPAAEKPVVERSAVIAPEAGTTSRAKRRNPFQIADPAVEAPVVPLPGDAMVPGDPVARKIDTDTASEPADSLSGIEPMALNGIRPGAATAQDLDQIWGEAPEKKTKDGAALRVYRLEQYKRVDVLLAEGKVTSIIVHLDKPAEPDAVTADWDLGGVRSVRVTDESGRALGLAFPERGVLFSYGRSAVAPRVQQVVLEPIDAQPFLLRAETGVYTEPRRSLADLDEALLLDGKYARAHWLRAELLSSIGRIKESLDAAQEACTLEPANADYRLTLGRVAEESGDNARAIKETQAAMDQEGVPDTVKAQALCQLGDMLAAGSDYKTAMAKHLAAIKLAGTLAQDPRNSVRQTGKQILMNAHLAVAHDIAWGNWQQKDKIVPKWLGRGAAHAEEMVADEGADAELKLRVAVRALGACAGAPEAIDAEQWIKIVTQSGKQVTDDSADSWRKKRLQWEVGLALYDAMNIVHSRGQFEQALAYGEQAIDYLQKGGVGRQRTPGQDFALGRLYYRIGSIYAIQKSDHATAITWYNQAAPLLEQPLRPVAMADLGRQGESLVSMGISYWETGQREEGLRLTQAGSDLMVQAVEKGILKQAALGVPYGNLAGMHQALQHGGEAKSYAALAAQADGTAKEASKPVATKAR